MANNQISDNYLVSVEVTDNTDLNFQFRPGSNAIETEKVGNPDCVIKVNQESFNRLFNGETTFEELVHLDLIKISGNHQDLRIFGNLLRIKNG